jgi:LuxR family transcriptional regulator, maltose regulon positive regulatory protein
VNALADVLTLACPQGYVRVFADEGPPMAALLARLVAARQSGGEAAEIPHGCLARLQRALDVGHAGPGPPARPGPRSGAGPGRAADQP